MVPNKMPALQEQDEEPDEIMELNAVPVKGVKAENLLLQNSQPVWKDVKKKFNQASNILAKAPPNTKLSKDFVKQELKGLDSFMQPQNLLLDNSTPIHKSV